MTGTNELDSISADAKMSPRAATLAIVGVVLLVGAAVAKSLVSHH